MLEEDEEIMRQLELLQKLSVREEDTGGIKNKAQKAKDSEDSESRASKAGGCGGDKEEDGGASAESESRRQFEQFYDPHADSDDEDWVRRNLTSSVSVSKNNKNAPYQLTCPCCFTLLCADAQAHEKYAGQFRAVAALNCTVRVASFAHSIIQINGSRIKDSTHAQKMLTVVCKQCETEVAVRDENGGLFIFCNVLY